MAYDYANCVDIKTRNMKRGFVQNKKNIKKNYEA